MHDHIATGGPRRGRIIAAAALGLAAGLTGMTTPALAAQAQGASAPRSTTAATAATATSAASTTTTASMTSTAVSGTPLGPIGPIRPDDRIRAKATLLLPHRNELVNTVSGLRADVMGASKEPTAGVFLWPDNTSGSQEFRLLRSPGGWFRLQAVHSGQCLMLDWRGGTYVNGTPIVQHPDCSSGYTPGEWTLRDVPPAPCTKGPPYYCGFRDTKQVLVNHRTGRCLDARNGAGGRPPAQAVLQQWDCVARDDAWNIGNQAWKFVDLDAAPPPPIH